MAWQLPAALILSPVLLRYKRPKGRHRAPTSPSSTLTSKCMSRNTLQPYPVVMRKKLVEKTHPKLCSFHESVHTRKGAAFHLSPRGSRRPLHQLRCLGSDSSHSPVLNSQSFWENVGTLSKKPNPQVVSWPPDQCSSFNPLEIWSSIFLVCFLAQCLSFGLVPQKCSTNIYKIKE